MNLCLNGAARLIILCVCADCLIGGVPALADETTVSITDPLGSTTLSGNVDTSAPWNFGTPLPSPSAVPEPSPLALGASGGLALAVWRMRSRRR